MNPSGFARKIQDAAGAQSYNRRLSLPLHLHGGERSGLVKDRFAIAFGGGPKGRT
jgi:hypothetical protein